MADAPSTDARDEGNSSRIAPCEVVGSFASPALLAGAVDQLVVAGVHRTAMSILGAKRQSDGDAVAGRHSAGDISDDASTILTAFATRLSPRQAQGISIAIPMEIGGFGAAWAVASAGGALLMAVGATLVGGAVGAGLGALLYYAVSRHHVDEIAGELADGGLVLWVRVDNDVTEERVLGVLRSCGAVSVHTHQVIRSADGAGAPSSGLPSVSSGVR